MPVVRNLHNVTYAAWSSLIGYKEDTLRKLNPNQYHRWNEDSIYRNMSCNKHEHPGELERVDTVQVFFSDLLQGVEKLHAQTSWRDRRVWNKNLTIK